MALPILRKRTIIDYDGGPKDVEVRHGKQVMPSNGGMHLRCGRCGSTDFTVHVRPLGILKPGAAQIDAVVCNVCAKMFNADNVGAIGGSITVTKTRDHIHRELINERHDTD